MPDLSSVELLADKVADLMEQKSEVYLYNKREVATLDVAVKFILIELSPKEGDDPSNQEWLRLLNQLGNGPVIGNIVYWSSVFPGGKEYSSRFANLVLALTAAAVEDKLRTDARYANALDLDDRRNWFRSHRISEAIRNSTP